MLSSNFGGGAPSAFKRQRVAKPCLGQTKSTRADSKSRHNHAHGTFFQTHGLLARIGYIGF
jgi:hypothetical protein